MSAPTFRLVFQGKIAPEQDLDEVKGRLQQLFKKDAATIDKMFSGKKIALKQGLSQVQAQQYQEKMRALGALCEIESQPPAAAAKSSSAAPVGVPQPASAIASGSFTQKKAASSSAETADQSPLKLADIDKAFSGSIPKVELPNSYKAGVVAVGITMVMLPIIYIGIIAMLGYGVLSHSASNVSWIQSIGYKFGLVAYVTPIIVGVTVMLFMIKPLFARPAAKASTIKLDSLKEPIFFHFVNKIALAVGAPRPKQIEVDCQVNASASFRKGLFSFAGDDLVLTIGMPLLAGFNARQLAGVLAHEFGHFSQGVGMRFHYLTYKVNSWFFNAVYLRDSWDEKLEQAAEEADGWVSVILNFARGGVWATRKVLYGFMMAGHAVSSYMLRQMEFDADRYEAHMAGSEQFKNTTLQLQRLGVAFQVSHDQLAQAWEDKKLVDNLPRLIVHNAMQLPEELDRALLNQMRDAKTQVYDSHPSDNERIDNAMRQQAKGIFSLMRESRDLFKSFDTIAKQVSYTYYAHELGLEVDKNKLVDVNQVVQITKENEKQQEAYHEYFKDMAPVFELPISVNIFDASKVDWDELLEQYRAVNEQIADQIGQRRKLMAQANESFDKYQKLQAIDIFRDCGFVLFPEWFGMDEQGFAKYGEMIPRLEQSWQQAMEQLQPMFALNDQRLSIALTLVNHPLLMERNAAHAQHLKTRNHLSLLINNFKRNAEYVTDFEVVYYKLAALLSCAPLMGQKPEQMPTVMNSLLENVRHAYDQLTAALGRLDYPFVAEGEHLTIADYIADFLPHKNHSANEYQYYMKCGEVTLEKLESIYARIISGLANIALTMDRLIPRMNEPLPVNEPVQVYEPAASATVANAPSNFADQPMAETPIIESQPVAEQPAPLTMPVVKDNMVKATFAIDQTEPDQSASQLEPESAEQTPAEPPESAAAETPMSVAQPVASKPAALELVAKPVEPSKAAASALEVKEASVNKPLNKAVFAIDEPKDDPEPAVKKPEVLPDATPRAKAVFAIDDPMKKADEQEEQEQSKELPVAQPSGKAVFAMDDAGNTPADSVAQKDNSGKQSTLSSANLNIGAVPERDAKDTTLSSAEPAIATAVETPPPVDTAADESAELSSSGSVEVTPPAVESVSATSEEPVESQVKIPDSLSLSLEPMATETTADAASSAPAAAADTPKFPTTTLSLEPIEEEIRKDEEKPTAETVAVASEISADTVANDAEAIDDDLASAQDSLVTESRAAVLTLEPFAKADGPAKSSTHNAVNGEAATEVKKKPQANAVSGANNLVDDKKDSDSAGSGLSVQSK